MTDRPTARRGRPRKRVDTGPRIKYDMTEDDIRMEREANLFAMCLLVPDFWLEEKFPKRRKNDPRGPRPYLDVENDPRIAQWAKELKVSEQILIWRICMFTGLHEDY